MNDLRLAFVSSVALLAAPGCGGGGSGTDCEVPPAFDISGTYTERYNCSEGDTCVDPDLSSTINITAVNVISGEYRFSDPDSDWEGTGQLCGMTFVWGASSASYTEEGVWTFADANSFVKTSDYEYREGGGGTCTGTGSQTGDPGTPAPIGGCLPD